VTAFASDSPATRACGCGRAAPDPPRAAQVFGPAGLEVEQVATTRLGHARDYVQGLGDALYGYAGALPPPQPTPGRISSHPRAAAK
jgi:hypothetical protein